MATISVDITGFYFGLDDVVVDANDSVADAMRKAVVRSISLNGTNADQPILIFETGPRGFSSTISVIHFVPPTSRQLNKQMNLAAGTYSYSDKLLGQNPVAAWQYYVIDANGKNKSKEDATTRDRLVVPCENSDVPNPTSNPTPVTFADGDQIVWRLVNISFGPSSPLPTADELDEIKQSPKTLEMREMSASAKFA